MIRIVSKLVAIALVLSLGTTLGYGRLEKWLLAGAPGAKKVMAASPSVTPRRLAPQGPPPPVTTPPPVAEKTPAPAKNDYGIIISRNIFHATLEAGKSSAPEKPIDTEGLGESKAPLSLQGTVAGGQSSARAIILDEKSKKQDIYRVGDSVQGAVIKAIERGKVVLQVNGRNEVLLIKDRQGDAGAGAGGNGGERSAVAPSSGRYQGALSPARAVSPSISSPRRRMTFRPPAGATEVPAMPEMPGAQTGPEHLEPRVEMIPESDTSPEDDEDVPPDEMIGIPEVPGANGSSGKY